MRLFLCVVCLFFLLAFVDVVDVGECLLEWSSVWVADWFWGLIRRRR